MKRIILGTLTALLLAFALAFSMASQAQAFTTQQVFEWHAEWYFPIHSPGLPEYEMTGFFVRSTPPITVVNKLWWDGQPDPVVVTQTGNAFLNYQYTGPYVVDLVDPRTSTTFLNSGVTSCGHGLDFEILKTDDPNNNSTIVASVNVGPFVTRTLYATVIGSSQWYTVAAGYGVSLRTENNLAGWISVYDQPNYYGQFCGNMSWHWPIRVKVMSQTARGNVTVPITVTDLGSSVLAYQFDLIFNPSVMSWNGFNKIGTLSEPFDFTVNEIAPGHISIGAYNTQYTAGGGRLLDLNFIVTGTALSTSPVQLNNFMFNENWPTFDLYNGVVTVAPNYYLTGAVRYGSYGYWDWETPVSGVSVQLSGPTVTSTTTNNTGLYSATLNAGGTFSITPSKPKNTDLRGAVSAYDAGMIMRCVVQIATCNLATADVTTDGWVTSLDAASVAQYVVGIPNPSHVGEWAFLPPVNTLSINNDANVNFNAVVKGDVSENWAWTSGGVGKPTTANPAPEVTFGQAVFANGFVTVPLSIARNIGAMQSADLHLQYDGASLVLDGVEAKNWSIERNGKHIVIYSLGGFNIPTSLRFKIVGKTTLSVSSLTVNEEDTITNAASITLSPAANNKLYLPLIGR